MLLRSERQNLPRPVQRPDAGTPPARRPGSTILLVLTSVVVVGMAAVSLTPVHYAGSTHAGASSADRYLPLTWDHWNPIDVIANVAFYMPAGALLFVYFKRRFHRAVALMLCTAAAAGISLMVECAQGFIPGRYATWYDVAANTLGAFVGAAIIAALVAELHSALSRATFPSQ